MNKLFLGVSIAFLSLATISIISDNNYSYANTNALNNKDTYYEDVDLSLSGLDFIDQLTPIINENYKNYGYGSQLHPMLAESDRDPNNPNNIICFYTGQSYSSNAWGSSGKNVINKEHVWAKSHGFPSSSRWAHADMHHLRPTQAWINSCRGNSDFGEVEGGSSDEYGNKWSGSIFEPRDEVKGDVARIMFYMEAKYNNIDGTDLTLVDHTTTTSEGKGEFGKLSTLIKWHYEDPVDDFERNRNDVIFKYQNNRNPYIDHPEYVDLAYPNEYVEVEVDQTKVDKVIELIDSLPQIIVIENKEAILNIYSEYKKLNYKEKELVTNYNKLVEALDKLAELENPDKPIEPDKPIIPSEGDININFKDLADYQYSLDKEVIVDNYKFYTNASYKTANEGLRIGHNKTNLKLESKYGVENITSDVALLETKQDLANIKSLQIELGVKYGKTDRLTVLFKETNSSTYTTIFQEAFVENDIINIDLERTMSGSVVIIADGGQKPRAVINQINFIIDKDAPISPDINPLKDIKTKSSIKFTIDNNEFISAGLRFGGIFNKNIFINADDFGVVTIEDKGISLASLHQDSLEKFKNNCTSNSIKYKIISSKNNAYVNEDNIQFAYVINNILDMPKTSFNSVIYIIKDGKLYFSNETTSSFIKTIENTKKLDLSSEKLALLEKALNILKK